MAEEPKARVIPGDAKMLLKRNRPAVATPAPAETEPAQAAVAAEDPITPTRSIPAAARKAPQPKRTTESKPSKTPSTADDAKERVTAYMPARLRERAVAAFKATAHLEADDSWSDFLVRSVQTEVERREAQHNNGQPFEGTAKRLPAGRPLRS